MGLNARSLAAQYPRGVTPPANPTPTFTAPPPRCIHLTPEPITNAEAAALNLSPLRDWRLCKVGHGYQCCKTNCGPKCPDYTKPASNETPPPAVDS